MKSLRDTGYFLDAEALQSNYFDEYSENRVIILVKHFINKLDRLFSLEIVSVSPLDSRYRKIYIPIHIIITEPSFLKHT